jgi:hypothetical protein
MKPSDIPGPNPLEPEQVELIKQLRTEVLHLKDCISKYSIQALVFAAAAVGIILKFQAENFSDPSQEHFRVLLGSASLPLLFPLRAVCRTAIHKLGTINRNLGYELHLQRSRSLPPSKEGWQRDYQRIGWEEAMRAWRIVQATLFAALCDTPVGAYKKEADPHRAKPPSRGYFWYDISALVAEGAKDSLGSPSPEYHAGNYVKKMLDIIHYSMAACLIPIPIAVFGSFLSNGTFHLTGTHALVLITGLLCLWYWTRSKDHDRIRLAQLESGILSIHSCAIIWRAVVVAHYRTVSVWKCQRYAEHAVADVRNGYTYLLARRAVQIAKCRFQIHEWTDGRRPDRVPARLSEVKLICTTDTDTHTHTATVLDIAVDGGGIAVTLPQGATCASARIELEGGPVNVRAKHKRDAASGTILGFEVDARDRERMRKFVTDLPSPTVG